MIEHDDFNPDWVSAPGETLTAILETRNISQSHFADSMGLPIQEAAGLLDGSCPITAGLAERLSLVVGATRSFWLRREEQYRSGLRRLQISAKTERYRQWLKSLPVADMMQYGWISRSTDWSDTAVQCLRYFGVPSVDAWRRKYESLTNSAAFRTSKTFDSDVESVAAWIRRAEIQSAHISTGRWNRSLFEQRLQSIRALTRARSPSEFLTPLRTACAESGVALAIVPAPSGCRASGAALFTSPRHPLILLSLRYGTDDHFWFTFFHEAGHLILHAADSIFIEGDEFARTSQEDEADAFAASFLVPDEYSRQLRTLPTTRSEILRFAKHLDISPGIVVGQLQHLGRVPRNHFNGLKRRYDWDNLSL